MSRVSRPCRAPPAPVKVVLVNLGTNTPALKVGSATAAYTATTNGNEVTLTYTPQSPLAGLVNCEITYAGAVGQWTCAVRTGKKALFVISSPGTPNTAESFVASRLATKYGLDIQFQDVSYLNANPTDLSIASNKVLFFVSSTIPSGNIANWAINFMTAGVPVPVLNWEYGNCDEWAFFEAGGGNGLVVNNPTFGGGVPVTHASRKVFFGLAYNSTAHLLNDKGLALLDAAIEWLLPPAPPALTATAGPGAGQMTLGWTGSGTLQTATNLAAPAWISAPSQSNPQTVPTTGTQRYYRVKQ